MNWQDLQKMISASPTCQQWPVDFRQLVDSKLPACNADQLSQLESILEIDRQNINAYMEASHEFKRQIKKKILGLEELLDQQKTMEAFDAANGSL